MPSQIFRDYVPLSLLRGFLNENCDVSDDVFVFNNNAYKRSVLNGSIEQFLEKLVPYYHTSKQHYVTRRQSYVRLTTVIRQICKFHNISHTSKITYNSSTYLISYYIIVPPHSSPGSE